MRRWRARCSADPRSSPRRVRSKRSFGGIRLPSVLIIDDSATAREHVREVLEESGRFERILEACDGIEGLRLLLSQSVDAVICDLEMPGLDGEKLLAAEGRHGEALAALLESVRRDPGHEDGAARLAMLDVFSVLGPDDPLTQEYRAALARTLFR